jgi:hypothetical protein
MSVSLFATSLLVWGCSSSDSSTSTASSADTKFAGTWAYEKGSSFVVACPGRPPFSQDLGTANKGQPGTFFLTVLDDTHVHEVDSVGCAYDWTANGDALTQPAGQSCDKFPDGRGGTTTGSIDTATKTSADGKTMQVTVRGKWGMGCTMSLDGVAQRSGG